MEEFLSPMKKCVWGKPQNPTYYKQIPLRCMTNLEKMSGCFINKEKSLIDSFESRTKMFNTMLMACYVKYPFSKKTTNTFELEMK